jgi:uncharacterized protein (DUF488 family)
MEIFTIGTSGRTAESFFETLEQAEVTSILDTRRHANSQLAGFAKADTLRFLSKRILRVPYFWLDALAPEERLLKEFKDASISWDEYELRYNRNLSSTDTSLFDFKYWGERPVVLCSEYSAEFCHRKSAADFLVKTDGPYTSVTHI